MFYEQNGIDPNLRFGDVIEGFQFIKPKFKLLPNHFYDLDLSIEKFDHLVILTPCCSIEKRTISVAPLRKLDPVLISNPYYENDFNNINRLVEPQNVLPPEVWNEKLTQQQRDERIGLGADYTYLDLFIYAPNEIFKSYNLSYRGKEIDCSHYMISFKDLISIESDAISREKTYPKKLQLSIKSRSELREKITWFYGRIPEEDKI